MYHAEFVNAKNYKGELYRDKDTGNHIVYCGDSYTIKPKFKNRDEFIAGEFSYLVKTFDGFEGVCEYCGNVILVLSENVVDDKTFDKRMAERVKEINKKGKKDEDKKKNL